MIANTELDAVVALVEQKGISETVISELRKQFPGKHFTWCMEDDINGGKPVVMRDTFAIYLVDSREHCSCLTTDLESASGMVLAEIIHG